MTPYPGMDMASLQALAAQFGPTEDEKRQARTMAMMQASFGLLGVRRGQEGQGIGGALNAGLLGYRQNLQDITKERGQNMGQAAQLADMMRKTQYQQALMNGDSAPQPPAQPTAQPAAMPPGIPQGNGVTTYPLQTTPPAAPTAGTPQRGGGIFDKLRELGVPEVAIKNAALSKDPADEIQKLIMEFSKPVFGQGKIPMQRTRDGYAAAPVAGYNEALAAQVSAETAATEAEKAKRDFIDVPMGNGQMRKMSRADAAKLLSSDPQPAPQGGDYPRVTLNIKDASRDDVLKAFEDARRSSQPTGSMGTTPNPLTMKQGEANIETDAQKQRSGNNTMLQNSQSMYEDIRKNYFASRAAKNHADNMEKNDKGEVFTGPGGALAANAANWFNSLVPGANISGDKLANTQYAEAEISRMQQSLGKAFPGQQSNYELTTVTNSLPTLMRTKEGRSRIYSAIKQAAALEEANYKSASDHMKMNNGNLVGWTPADMPPIEQFQPAQATATKRWVWDGKKMVQQ